MSIHDPSSAVVACNGCGATILVPLQDDTLEFPQQSQVIDFLTQQGWTVIMKGFRIRCFCPENDVILGDEGQ